MALKQKDYILLGGGALAVVLLLRNQNQRGGGSFQGGDVIVPSGAGNPGNVTVEAPPPVAAQAMQSLPPPLIIHVPPPTVPPEPPDKGGSTTPPDETAESKTTKPDKDPDKKPPGSGGDDKTPTSKNTEPDKPPFAAGDTDIEGAKTTKTTTTTRTPGTGTTKITRTTFRNIEQGIATAVIDTTTKKVTGGTNRHILPGGRNVLVRGDGKVALVENIERERVRNNQRVNNEVVEKITKLTGGSQRWGQPFTRTDATHNLFRQIEAQHNLNRLAEGSRYTTAQVDPNTGRFTRSTGQFGGNNPVDDILHGTTVTRSTGSGSGHTSIASQVRNAGADAIAKIQQAMPGVDPPPSKVTATTTPRVTTPKAGNNPFRGVTTFRPTLAGSSGVTIPLFEADGSFIGRRFTESTKDDWVPHTKNPITFAQDLWRGLTSSPSNLKAGQTSSGSRTTGSGTNFQSIASQARTENPPETVHDPVQNRRNRRSQRGL